LAEIEQEHEVGGCRGTEGRREMTDTSPNFGVRAEYSDPVRRLLSIGESWENDP
jgi:hypothetical protein